MITTFFCLAEIRCTYIGTEDDSEGGMLCVGVSCRFAGLHACLFISVFDDGIF